VTEATSRVANSQLYILTAAVCMYRLTRGVRPLVRPRRCLLQKVIIVTEGSKYLSVLRKEESP